MDIQISIDKMVLVGDLKKINGYAPIEKMLNDEHNNYILDFGISKYPYNYYWKLYDSIFIQYSRENKFKDIRIEFNPNKISEELNNYILELLTHLQYCEYNRIDIALDFFGEDLSSYQIIDKKGRKSNYWLDGKGNLETKYIGAKDSDLRIRIYDKAKEQKKDGIEVNQYWWRIEAQIRNKKLENILNAFDGIIIKKIDLNEQSKLKFEDECILRALLENETNWGRLTDYSRKKYKKILAQLSTSKKIDLQNIYKQKIEDITNQLELYLLQGNKSNTVEVDLQKII